MTSNFPYDEEELLNDPKAMLALVKRLYQDQSKLVQDQSKLDNDRSKLIQKQSKQIGDLIKQTQDLIKQIQDLKNQLAKYTSPHIPSSKQLYPKTKKRSANRSGLPKRPTKKRGGSKKGKAGATWAQAEPDKVIHIFVDQCLGCNKQAEESMQKISFTKRILESPEKIQIGLEEHHVYQYQCPNCGTCTQAAAPTLNGTSFGPNLLSLISVLRYRTGSSFENIAAVLEDQSNVSVSDTAVYRGISRVSEVMNTLADQHRREVLNSDWFHVDETGHKLVEEGRETGDGSQKVWVWVFANENTAAYFVEMNRSQKVLKKGMQFREEGKPPPTVVSDYYPAYHKFFPSSQYCWAHLLRDSKDLAQHCFKCQVLHFDLNDLYLSIKALRKGLRHVNSEVVARLMQDLIDQDYDCDNTKRLQKRLGKAQESYMRCARNQSIPMTNNLAERLLKSVILHRSNGKNLRSKRAMDLYADMLTVFTTWKQRNLPLGDTLTEYLTKFYGKPTIISTQG